LSNTFRRGSLRQEPTDVAGKTTAFISGKAELL